MRWVLLALVGCGRLDFADLGDGGLPGGDGSATCSVEVCNGIDDDCDGLVDEGCPCTPWTGTFGLLLPTMLSTGTDWIVGDFAAGAERLDGTTGAIVGATPIPGLGELGTKQELAWDGSHAAAFDGAIELYALDGTLVETGPQTGIAAGTNAIAWNGNGFDIACSTLADSTEIEVVSTDPHGVPIGGVATSTPYQMAAPIVVARLAGAPFYVWGENDSATFGERGAAGSPTPPALAPSATFGVGPPLDASSDGTRVIAVGDNTWAVDASGATMLAVGGLFLQSIAWTGNGWDAIYVLEPTGTATVMLVHFDTSYNVMSMQTAISIPYASSLQANAPWVVADARRTLVQWDVGADNQGIAGHLAQFCH